jgi:hypothetical protein
MRIVCPAFDRGQGFHGIGLNIFEQLFVGKVFLLSQGGRHAQKQARQQQAHGIEPSHVCVIKFSEKYKLMGYFTSCISTSFL